MYSNNNNYGNNPYNSYNYNQMSDYESRLNNNYNINDNINMNNKHFSIKKILFILILIILLIFGFIITKNLLKSYKMTFKLNGADEIENTEMECKSNIKGECYLTLPIVKRNNGEVIGYSLDANGKEAQYKIGDKIEMNNDMVLYVISKKELKLNIDKSDINEVNNSNTLCEIYNTENSCEVEIPMFNKYGYKIDGYTKDKNNKTDLILLGSKYILSNDLDLYPVYSEFQNYTYTKKLHFNIEKSIYSYNTYIDVGYGCNSNVVTSLTNNLKKLYSNFPFYAYYSKITLLSDQEFIKYANNERDVYGLTDDKDIDNPAVLIRCSEDLSSYLTAVHELSHALDIRYKKIYGHYINEEKEIIELRNKYRFEPNRPLREYGYDDKSNTSVPEFFAELMTFYYINYIDTTCDVGNYYNRGNYPDDLKKIAEKYICIAKNNYDKTNCS